MHIYHKLEVFLCTVICVISYKIKKNEAQYFVLRYKNLVLGDGNGFKLCKKHVKSRLNVKNMTNLKKNIAQSFIT